MKKIIFFDADGTLWYPKKTKRLRHPVWIYKDKRYKKHAQHLELTPHTMKTLIKLKSLNIKLIVLSTSPYPSKKAKNILMNKIKFFNLENIFDEIYATKEVPSSKGEYIEKILEKYSFPKKSALMVGDSFKWDYNSAVSKNIDALLIKNEYEKNIIENNHVIKEINQVINFL